MGRRLNIFAAALLLTLVPATDVAAEILRWCQEPAKSSTTAVEPQRAEVPACHASETETPATAPAAAAAVIDAGEHGCLDAECCQLERGVPAVAARSSDPRLRNDTGLWPQANTRFADRSPDMSTAWFGNGPPAAASSWVAVADVLAERCILRL